MLLRQQTRATVLLSGGIDSASCAHLLQHSGAEVRALFVDHGQAAAGREAVASAAVAEHLAIPLETCRVSNPRRLGAGELLGRNPMLLFNALFLTQGLTDFIALGLHAGVPYYDCSEAFASSAKRMLGELTDGRVSLVVPFISWTKREVFDYFLTTGLPLASTYSCESGSDPACGICASCRDRKALGC